jgi:hypothetical protein
MVEPKHVNWVVSKHVSRYMLGIVGYGLSYIQGDGVNLVGYSDAYWACSVVDKKSTIGCCFNLG